MKPTKRTDRSIRLARRIWPNLSREAVTKLRVIATQNHFSVSAGDLIYLNSGWYVTHTGLIRLAARRRCRGIEVQAIPEFSDALNRRYAFKATVYKSRETPGFVGYGDADPSNVSDLVRGAEMRVAETRAVNRALRKAYGIGICSLEEIGSAYVPLEKIPPQKTNGNGNGTGVRVRDRLCQIIGQHSLDAELVKAYAVDFCGTRTLHEATREQVENFVQSLADWAE
jgi:hypothetical protein